MARKPAATAPAKERPAVKKLSRKSIADLDTREFVAISKPAIRRLMGYVKPYRGRFALGVFFGIVFGVFNAAVLFGLKFVFEILLPSEVTTFDIKIPMVGQWSIDKPGLDGGGSPWLVVLACGIIPVLILVRGLLGYLNSYFMLWVGQRVLKDLRTRTFSCLMRQSLRFYSKTKGGELIQTVFNQTRMVASAGSDLAANMVKHPISIVTIVVSLFIMDWVFALASLVVFPLCMLPVVYIGRRVRKAGGQEEAEAGAVMVTMQEAFAGIRVVKSLAREDHEIDRFTKGAELLERLVMRWRKAMEIVGPMVETVASLGIAAGLAYAWWVRMPAAEFLILYAALMAIYPHAKSLSQLQIQLQKCLVAASKVFEIQDRPLEIADKPDAVTLVNARGLIEFDETTFAYKKGLPAVHKVSLCMEPGKRYALVGRSGAGKTTLFSLLLRFYDPDGGCIRVDGRDLRDYTQQSLRDHIGIVNQDTFLFHDTIATNIRYGKLDASDAEIEAAARRAHAHDFILAQPKGYDTVIGDKGANISGGQQQRLAIARAFVRDAPILLLDEATSALDSESEGHILDAVDEFSRGKTVIAIAHRLSTILSADAIVMMEDGKVLGVAPHQELLVTCPAYRRLYDHQFKDHAPAG
jgi:ABC-type multidrug transport system fused ATPase/permease subunit